MTLPIACLTGASGGLGRHLLPRLLETHRVRALVRKETPEVRAWAARGCEVVVGDLGDEAALGRLTREADVVIHAAARILGMDRAAFVATNVEGTRRLAEESVRQGCRRFVHVSTIAVYAGAAPGDGEDYHEALALDSGRVTDPYGHSKLLGERAVLDATRGTATGAVVLRPTCIHGAGMESWTGLPLRSIARGRALLAGVDGGAGMLDVVHVDDVVAGVLAAVGAAGVEGEVFNLGHEQMRFAEFYEALGELAGRAPRYGSSRVLQRMRKVAAWVSRWDRRMAPGLRDGIDLLLHLSANARAYPSDKARQRLGYAPRVSLAQGMLRTELNLREQRDPAVRPRRLWNADRHYCVRPQACARPATVECLAAVLREAARRGLRVKALGSLHSFVPIPDTDGIAVSLRGLDRWIQVDGTRVTVEAGMTVAAFNAGLARRGLALPVHGSHTAQTLGGAVATGTHGGSLHQGTLADAVEALEMVTVTGESVTLKRGDPGFGGAVVSLGLLGIVHRLTFQCVPHFHLEGRVEVRPLREVLEGFDAIQRGNEFVDLLYHPRAGMVEMLLANRVPSGLPMPASIARRTVGPLGRKLVSFHLRLLLRGLAVTPIEGVHRTLARKMVGVQHRPRRGPCEEVLAFTDLEMGEPFPIDDLEFALPYERAVEVLEWLSGRFASGRRPPTFFPIHVRCSRGGEQWLGPNRGRDTFWLEFWSHPPDPGLYRDLHAWLSPFEYRPHWGKISVLDPGALSTRYPEWDAFSTLRRRFDPEGRLLNARTREWFGNGVAPGSG